MEEWVNKEFPYVIAMLVLALVGLFFLFYSVTPEGGIMYSILAIIFAGLMAVPAKRVLH